MYLQITTKCNMNCDHCCYSCNMGGKHGNCQTIMDAISFASDYDCGEFITIGGGEPTLHPDFFIILEKCLCEFHNVWMATNGSQTEVMLRLADIIDGIDFPECDCLENFGQESLDEYGCLCHEKMDYDSIHVENEFNVAVSQDYFHDQIDAKIIDIWKRRKWELRDVTSGITGLANVGRAKDNNLASSNHCCCSDLLIQPDGKIRLCGCPDSPIVGDIYNGVSSKWEEVMSNDEGFQNEMCYKGVSKHAMSNV